MLAIPAIDLKDGKVVRLVQGRYEEPIVYSHDPTDIAKTWEKQGAKRIHLVDLDGAVAGESRNITAAREIVESVSVPVEFGGGLRTREDIIAVLDMGAKWAVLGTKACEDLDFARKTIGEFAEKVIISIDVKFKKVAIRGWTQTMSLSDVELIKKLKETGVKSFIYTDISRDGTLSGSNIAQVKRILEETGVSLIYSGGICGVQDIKNLKKLEKLGLDGIIIGKALYEDKIHLSQAKRIAEEGLES